MTSALAVRTAIINARMVASDNFQFKLMFCMHSFHLPVDRKAFVIPDLYFHARRLSASQSYLGRPSMSSSGLGQKLDHSHLFITVASARGKALNFA
jgi:hypothetical protein